MGGYSEHTVANVARIDKNQKRQHLLIEAFNLIKDRYPDWSLELWGETDFDLRYTEFCKSLVRKYGLSKRIRFCGTTDDVAGVLAKVSIFAFPSAFEGFGLALTEAMSMGLPAVGYRSAPAVNEIIEDGVTGYLCDDGVIPLSEALAVLMDDEQLRIEMGSAAKQAMIQFAEDNVWEQWDALIKRCIK